MKAVRTLLRDRLSAGAIVALVAYILLLQALFAGLSHGAMAATAANFGVICSATATNGSHDAQDPRAVDCPCATLCQQTAGATPAVLDASAALANPFPATLSTDQIVSDALTALTPRNRLAESRAPPVSA